ncbi:MAG: type II toxin-antitoxin system HicB family antitoxin [Deltaproteobacteria bacterium]|nr:type II toxin-antitoxin system HicB family antitoxin [Deltaproteobacteria bacterium]
MGPRVRVNITLPAAIDQFAARHGQSRSGFLVAAARRAMGKAA